MEIQNPWETFSELTKTEQSAILEHLQSLDRLEECLAAEMKQPQGTANHELVTKLRGQISTLVYQTCRILKCGHSTLRTIRSDWKNRQKVGT